MVSLDAVNLFTKVSTDGTLTAIRDKLATDPSLEKRICIPVDGDVNFLCENNLLRDEI